MFKWKISTAICSGVHWSRLTDLTLEMWTPRLRWMPAHRMQMKMPKFHDVHRGPLASQSAQYLFSSSRSILLNMAWYFSCSLAALSFDNIDIICSWYLSFFVYCYVLFSVLSKRLYCKKYAYPVVYFLTIFEFMKSKYLR